MNEEPQVETEAVVPTTTPEAPEASAPSQEAIQAELDRIDTEKETAKRTKREKLEFTKARIERQLADLGDDDASNEDPNRPLTVREYEARKIIDAQDTALQLADDIGDEAERRLVKHHLENTIKPSGDPQTDLRNARLIVNSVKNSQLAEEAGRTVRARTAPSAPSAPPGQTPAAPELSTEENRLVKGFKLTPEEVAAALKQ